MSDPRPTATYAQGDPAGGFLRAIRKQYPDAPLQNAWWFGNGCVELKRMSKRKVEVLGFWIAPNRRGRGHGASMMDQLTGLADRHNTVLQLIPIPYDAAQAMLTDQLYAWYGRWGFVTHPTRPGYLIRSPRTP